MINSAYLNSPIPLFKDNVVASRGTSHIISNIDACQIIVDMIRTTLGPRGMDKLIYTDEQRVTTTNDGATVLDLLNVVHPAVRVLINTAKAQDTEVGDGTTSVVLLAGELLVEAKYLLQEGVPVQTIIRGYQKALHHALEKLQENLVVWIPDKEDKEGCKTALKRCAQTTLSSKLISAYQDIFSSIVVDAVLTVDAHSFDKSMIGIKKVPGGSVAESRLICGVAFKKTFSYAGFEQQPKKFVNPKVLLLNVELELKAEKENAEVRISSPEEYQSIVDAEWKIIFNKLDAIVATKAQVVLSGLPIGDLATQYFAEKGVFCAGRVDKADLRRTALATGSQVVSTVTNLKQEVLGACGLFEEVQIGSERYNLFTECPKAKSATIILRGGAQQFIEETERSLNDAIMIVNRALQTTKVVGGGGAIEMELSSIIRQRSRDDIGKQQLVMNSFAKALECIPRTLAQNGGLDQMDILNKLRRAHHDYKSSNRFMGISFASNDVCDTYEEFIWEPSLVKSHAIAAAVEAACLILSIDETIKNPKANSDLQQQSQGLPSNKNAYRMQQRGARS